MDLHKRSMTQFMMISPIIESEMLPLHPYQFMSRGAIVDIPIMMGTTYDEGNLFIFEGFQKELDEVGYWALLGVVFGFDKVDTVQKMYPPDKSTKDQRLVMSQLTSDVVFHCVNRNISSMIARREGDTPEQKAWVYVFDHVASFMKVGYFLSFIHLYLIMYFFCLITILCVSPLSFYYCIYYLFSFLLISLFFLMYLL